LLNGKLGNCNRFKKLSKKN